MVDAYLCGFQLLPSVVMNGDWYGYYPFINKNYDWLLIVEVDYFRQWLLVM